MKALYTNDVETYIATSSKDAIRLQKDLFGYVWDEDDDPFYRMDDDESVTVNFDVYENKTIERGGTHIPRCATREKTTFTASASAWAKSNKCSFLCSTEW